MVQREMGRQPNEFIPVKYTNQSVEQYSNVLLNVLVGSMFLLFFYQVFKNKNQPGGGNLGKGGKANPPNKDNKSGGWFGNQGGF